MNNKKNFFALALSLSVAASCMTGVFAENKGVETTSSSTAEATPLPTAEATSAPTAEATPLPTAEATSAPTAEVIPVPTVEVTSAPTTVPTIAPKSTTDPRPSFNLVTGDLGINTMNAGPNLVDINTALTEDDVVKVSITHFKDISFKDWFIPAVTAVAEKGIVYGVTEKNFEPNTYVTRAMFATMLWRYDTEKITNSSFTFTDIPYNAYYMEAAKWTAGEGLIIGYDAETFAPDDTITREQAVTILYRYAQRNGMDMSGYADISIYDDSMYISDYAVPSLTWAVGSGIMSGRTKNDIDPQAKMTRAETAQVFYNFINFAE